LNLESLKEKSEVRKLANLIKGKHKESVST
jgi:hypothetical protein